jgi:hypothetical protein
MKSKRRSSDSHALVDALTGAALTRDMDEAVSIVRAMGKGPASPDLIREARGCAKRLRSIEQFRASLGLAPLHPSARAIAV